MINTIKIGWIDYSNQHRDKVMSVLHLLSEPQAVDELGIGLIRDGFADILFPGTSTVQRSAKYFLIVPYILMELEKQNHKSPKDMLDKLSKEEIDLIEVLAKDGADGVIGVRSREKLKRKPSSIYWNGLRTFGLFSKDKLSLDAYVRAFYSLKKSRQESKKLGYEKVDNNDCNDDDDVARGELIGEFWRCIIPKKNWRDNLTIELTKEEGEYLKSKILKSPKSKDTLLSFLLKYGNEKVEEINDFDTIGEIFDLPEELRDNYYMARDFSHFIYGANLRYNYILTKGENEYVNEQWDNWYNSKFVKESFVNFDIDLVFDRLNINNGRLLMFLNTYKKIVLSSNLEELDKFIVNREVDIKGKERAKLTNPDLAYYGEENKLRGSKLDFRFAPAKRLIIDIVKGIEGESYDKSSQG